MLSTFHSLHYFNHQHIYKVETVISTCRRSRFNRWVRKVPRRSKWQPTPVFLPRESHGQRSLAAYRPWGGKELDMTKRPTHNKIWKLRTSRQEWLVPGAHEDTGHTETQDHTEMSQDCGPRHLDPGPWGSGSEITGFSITPLPRWWGGVSIIQDAQDLYIGMCKGNTRTYISACCLFILNFYWSIVALQCCISFTEQRVCTYLFFWISFPFRSPQGTESPVL